jgi:DUF1680 family protein
MSVYTAVRLQAVQPSAGARIAARGLVDAAIVGGSFWGERQRANREVSLVEALQHLDDWGGLPYLRAAATGGGVPDVPAFNDGHVYKILDSDVYKWLEAVAYESLRAPLPESLREAADEIVDLIVAAQRPEGGVHSWSIVHDVAPLSNWLEGHEMYCGGHLVQAAVAWRRAFDDDRLQSVAIRLMDFFQSEREKNPALLSLHPGLEMALVELYRVTGERRFLDQARDNLERRGHDSFGFWKFAPEHFVDDIPVREATEIRGHAVMALFLLCGMVDVAVETGDRELLAAAESQWQDMVDRKLYLTGGAGSRQLDEAFGNPYELAPDTAYAETCAAVGSVMLSWRLLLATGDDKYADLIERTVYNGFLSGVSLDGHRYLYVNPLHVREPGKILSPSGYTHREEWFMCACCPPNAMRLISTIAEYLATTDAEGIRIHQLIPGQVEARGRVVRIDTDLPFGDGVVELVVTGTDEREWSLAVRVPSWWEDVTVSTSWGETPVPVEGLLRITREWREGDSVRLTGGLTVRRVAAHPRVDAVRGQEALMRGPIVLAVEEPGIPEGIEIESLRLPPSPVAPVRESEIAPGVPSYGVDVRIAGGSGTSLYRPAEAGALDDDDIATVSFQPYFSWGNSGACRMKVWLPVAS